MIKLHFKKSLNKTYEITDKMISSGDKYINGKDIEPDDEGYRNDVWFKFSHVMATIKGERVFRNKKDEATFDASDVNEGDMWIIKDIIMELFK